LKVVTKYVIYEKSALIQGMDWCRQGAKPFLESLLTKGYVSWRKLAMFMS